VRSRPLGRAERRRCVPPGVFRRRLDEMNCAAVGSDASRIGARHVAGAHLFGAGPARRVQADSTPGGRSVVRPRRPTAMRVRVALRLSGRRAPGRTVFTPASRLDVVCSCGSVGRDYRSHSIGDCSVPRGRCQGTGAFGHRRTRRGLGVGFGLRRDCRFRRALRTRGHVFCWITGRSDPFQGAPPARALALVFDAS